MRELFGCLWKYDIGQVEIDDDAIIAKQLEDFISLPGVIDVDAIEPPPGSMCTKRCRNWSTVYGVSSCNFFSALSISTTAIPSAPISRLGKLFATRDTYKARSLAPIPGSGRPPSVATWVA